MAIDPTEFRRITGPEPSTEFIYQENFVSPEDCNEVIATFERNKARTAKDAPGNSFFSDRYMWFTSLPKSEMAARRVMQQARHRIVSKLMQFYNEPDPIYSDSIQLVKWYEGPGMPAHADNAHPDGARHNTPWRKYASVVYLNDDYEGGDFYFTRLKLRVKIRQGLLVAFRGGFEHEHGVMAVTRGVRYTMPAWYGTESKYADKSEREFL